jgi:hypothetical protein
MSSNQRFASFTLNRGNVWSGVEDARAGRLRNFGYRALLSKRRRLCRGARLASISPSPCVVSVGMLLKAPGLTYISHYQRPEVFQRRGSNNAAWNTCVLEYLGSFQGFESAMPTGTCSLLNWGTTGRRVLENHSLEVDLQSRLPGEA